MKKVLSFILATIMVLSLFPVVFAADECSHDWTWTYYCEEKTEYDCTDADTVVKRKGVCGLCSEEVIDVVPVQSQHYWIQQGTTEPECEKYTMSLFGCAFCTATKSQVLSYKEHSWGNWVVTVKCFEGTDAHAKGEQTRTCKDCGAAETKQTNNHTYIIMEGALPTCFKNGVMPFQTCVECGTRTPREEIPMLTHTDEDANGKCDLCDGLMAADGTACRCICHSDMSLVQEFLLPILQFIWNLLKMNVCNCGIVHA